MTRTSALINIELEKGSTFKKQFTWTQNGSPVDLRDATAELQIRRSLSSNVVLFTMSTSDGSIVLGGLGGTVNLLVSEAVSAAFDWGKGVYDLEIYFDNGNTKKLTRGDFYAHAEVTRDE